MTEILAVIGLLGLVLGAGLRSSNTSATSGTSATPGTRATPGPLLMLLLIAGSAWYVLG